MVHSEHESTHDMQMRLVISRGDPGAKSVSWRIEKRTLIERAAPHAADLALVARVDARHADEVAAGRDQREDRGVRTHVAV